jgi:hypothetical protein
LTADDRSSEWGADILSASVHSTLILWKDKHIRAARSGGLKCLRSFSIRVPA